MEVDDFFNPHEGSTTNSFSHSQPTITELSAQMAQLLHMQTLAPNLILNQDPILMTPKPDPKSGSYFDDPEPDPDYDDDDPDLNFEDDLDPTPMMTLTPNLSLIQTPTPISTPTQAQIPIQIPTQPVTLKDQRQCNTTSNGTGYGFHTSDKIDSSATDHMTFDPDDFLNTTQPRRTCIANANGITYLVTGANTVALSSSLTLSNTLLDIHTKEILGRGTKRGGLYYVNDFNPGMANNVTHPFDSKQKQIWLWHHRLGHPSFSYMKHLIPDLFSGFKDSDFTCDT
ncbi:unnamed protein product [Prunus armeniaca]